MNSFDDLSDIEFWIIIGIMTLVFILGLAFKIHECYWLNQCYECKGINTFYRDEEGSARCNVCGASLVHQLQDRVFG